MNAPKIEGLARPYRLTFPVYLGKRSRWELCDFIMSSRPSDGLNMIEPYETGPGEVMIPRMRQEDKAILLTMFLMQDETAEQAYNRVVKVFEGAGWETDGVTT
jgi:hypothetical protein